MNRKSLIAIAAFAVLGLVAFLSLRQPEKGEGTAERQRPLAKIAAGHLDTLQILRGGVTTTAGGLAFSSVRAGGSSDSRNGKAIDTPRPRSATCASSSTCLTICTRARTAASRE